MITAKENSTSQKLAVVLVRGTVKSARPVEQTLALLQLHRKNHCVVVANTPSLKGMVTLVKDYVTWGEISEPVFKELVAARGEEYKGRSTDSKKKYHYAVLDFNGKKYKTYFRLNPPRKGFGRKGIKVAFVAGGGLGYRGDKINDLIQRML